MERALSESIFCCPRVRVDFFFREECFAVEALFIVLAGFAEDDGVTLCCLRVLALVAGF